MVAWERAAARVWYGWIIGGSLAAAAFDRFWPASCNDCPPHLLLVAENTGVNHAIASIVWLGVAAMTSVLVGVLVGRWWRSSPVGRQHLSALGLALLPVLAVAVVIPNLQQFAVVPRMPPRLGTYVSNMALAALPIVLVVELLRVRLTHARVADLLHRLQAPVEPGQLESMLADAVGDPGLKLAFPHGQNGFLGVDGRPLPMPSAESSEVTATPSGVEQTGAVVLHDAALDPGLVRSVASAAGLWLENERLHAEVRAQLEEVRRSRARIVAASDEERRRVERDLHDGAQQRLVALAMSIDQLRSHPRVADHEQLQALANAAIADASTALAELRDLARGIYPPILHDKGLGAALQSLADRAALPVSVDAIDTRYAPEVEAVGYFVASECITNAAKHAEAAHLTLELTERGADLVLRIHDDGRGGADPAGRGLQGLRDRVEALGGTFDAMSSPAEGTTVTAALPVRRG